jgi:hypothetical protein
MIPLKRAAATTVKGSVSLNTLIEAPESTETITERYTYLVIEV